MVEIINRSVCRGVAGRRTSATPKGVVIHNDAGSVNATAKHYVNALEAMSVSQLENGFAHYYIDRNTTARVEDTFNKAWHTANTDGNANYVGYEVCQSLGASDTDFLANEQATFKQVAEDLKYWKLPANRDTIKLHNQFTATACPHRSQALHGNGVACQDYFIQEVKKYMGIAPSPQPTPPTKPPVANTPNTTAGAFLPVKFDGSKSKAHLNEFGQNTATTLYTRGWHIGNYKYQYLFIMDYNTDREIARKLAKGVSRPDVNKAYNTTGNVGFSENWNLAQFRGRKIYVMARCTNDPTGNTVGGFSDIAFKDWFHEISK